MKEFEQVLAGEQAFSIEKGDCLEWLAMLPDQSVDMAIFSPPYEKARLYLEEGKNLNIARKTYDWVAWMARVMEAAVRVTRGLVVCVCEGQTKNYSWSASPILLMAELVKMGITLRKPPIFHRVGIPGSGGPDWWRNDYEFCICATRGGRLPWSNNTATGKPSKYGPGGPLSHRLVNGERISRHCTSGRGGDAITVIRNTPLPAIANPGNVITCSVGGGKMGDPLAHLNEAPFPESLIEPFVKSFCPPNGVVLDCCAGSGTTLAVAIKNGRRAIGCDLRDSQVELTNKRLNGLQLELNMENN